MSLSVAIQVNALDAMPAPLSQGARVVLQAKPVFWTQRGSLMLDARQIRPVGVGELLARVEHLKRTLAAEGLFDAERKKPLPFLPRTVGLVCGRASAAEQDVVENARRRWPAPCTSDPAGRGAGTHRRRRGDGRPAASSTRDPEVDVIVISPRRRLASRTCCRSATRAWCEPWPPPAHPSSAPSATTSTPPCSTSSPTAAPPPPPTRPRRSCRMPAESASASSRPPTAPGAPLPAGCTERAPTPGRDALSRPVLADKGAFVRGQREVVEALARRARRRVEGRLHRARDHIEHLRAQVRTLSPQSTLDRGLRDRAAGRRPVVSDPAELEVGELLRVRVARGDFAARPSVAGLPTRLPAMAKKADVADRRHRDHRRAGPGAGRRELRRRGAVLRAGPRRARRHRRPARERPGRRSRRAWACGSAARRWPRTAPPGSTAPRRAISAGDD